MASDPFDVVRQPGMSDIHCILACRTYRIALVRSDDDCLCTNALVVSAIGFAKASEYVEQDRWSIISC